MKCSGCDKEVLVENDSEDWNIYCPECGYEEIKKMLDEVYGANP